MYAVHLLETVTQQKVYLFNDRLNTLLMMFISALRVYLQGVGRGEGEGGGSSWILVNI